MTVLRGNQAEEMEARLSELNAEIQSLTDELAEVTPYKEKYEALKLENLRLMSDRSVVV